MLWDKKVIYRILFIFLCLGLVSGIVFYVDQISQVRAEVVSTSVTVTICGNAIEEGDEECDDGNADNTDACLDTCLDASCGDSYIWDGVEECDDGNTASGDGCSSTCQTEEEPSNGGGGGGGGGGGALPPPVTTQVILQGKAYPAAFLTVLKDGQVVANSQANSQGNFKFDISNVGVGIYTFGIWAEDKNGVKSITFSFTVNIARGAITTISGIFIPPTISLARESVKRGESLAISGQTASEADVEIHLNSDKIVENVIAGALGDWFYNLDTGRLEEGIHSARAKASTIDGLLSTFSNTLLFGVGVGLPPGEGVCPHADLNHDNTVNLIDFSILLYWWGRSSECADQNSDNVVNLIDFSIMLYHWTG